MIEISFNHASHPPNCQNSLHIILSKNGHCTEVQVEQKNWAVVRRLAGYGRYDTQKQVDQLNALYAVARLHNNFFRPVMKLQAKQRDGSKVKKIFDAPKTPCQRLLESDQLSRAAKRKLKVTYESLNLAEVKAELDRRIAALKPSRTFTDTQSDS